MNQILILRQVAPTKNNAAVNSLSKDIQIRNVRKVKTSANVTFVIWILEMVANLNIYGCWVMGPSYEKYFFEVCCIWYYVILPHTYLMNTSHNKERIVDDGLWVTVKNAVRFPIDVKTCIGRSQQSFESNVENNTKDTITRETFVNSSDENEQKARIFTQKEILSISKAQNKSKINQDCNLLSIPDDIIPSTSKGINNSNRKERRLGWSKSMHSESETESIDICDSQCHLITRKEILHHMVKNIDYEEHYLHYFFQLIQYEEKIRDDDTNDFYIEHMNDSQYRKLNKELNECTRQILLSVTDLEPRCYNRHKLPLRKNYSGIQYSSSDIVDRIEARKVVLTNYHLQCDNEQDYETYLTKLIDFEENLADN